MATDKKFFLLVLILVYLLPFILFHEQVNTSISALPGKKWLEENGSTVHIANVDDSEITEPDQKDARSFKEDFSEIIQGEYKILQLSLDSDYPSFTRHLMCKDYEVAGLQYNPVHPTTIFRPSDTKAVCLTTVNISDTIEFRWHYRNDSSKIWISAYNWSRPVFTPGKYDFQSYLLIAGYWPGTHYPRGYRIDVYLDGSHSFSEFFEVTNGGLSSPRTCEDVDLDNRNPINIKSRFTIDVDGKVHHYFSFSKIAYFNDELNVSHNFTTIWIQPDGSTYKTYSDSFSDYKDVDMTWNCWERSPYDPYDFILINSTTPVGNWKVEVYLNSYLNNTWSRYGPVATTPFVVGSEPAADWTVMAYLDGDNSLETAGVDLFRKMASVDSSSRVNVVAQLDRVPGQDSRYGNWTDCKRFNITKGMTPTAANATMELGEQNMGHPDTLNSFINWTINYFPANKYFLVLWNHGTGFMGFCYDTTNNDDYLSLPELSQALNGLPVILNVVLVDACSMGMVEVAYQIRNYANVLIAPEGLGWTPSCYDNYLTSLIGNPHFSQNAFAAEAVTHYIDWCRSIDVTEIPNATMSAIDLTKISGLIEAIDDFASTLKDKETFSHELLNLARNLTQELPGPFGGQTGNYIDLYHFAQQTYQQVDGQELRNVALQVMTELSIGNTMIAEDQKALPDSHGSAVFFPGEREKYENFESTYEKTAFAEDTLWDEFVKHHLDLQTDGSTLTIQTPFSNILIEIGEEFHTTDSEGKVQAFVLPDSYTVKVPTPVYLPAEPGSRGTFIKWHDDEPNSSRTIIVTSSITYTAYYETQYEVGFNQSGIAADFSGTILIVDETSYNDTDLPVSFWWANGSNHQFVFQSPLSVTPYSKRYSWNSTHGMASTQSQQLTVSASGTIIGYYRVQFFLTLATDPPGVTTPSAEGWYYNGTDATISADEFVDISLGASRYQFKTWTVTDMAQIADPNSSSTTVRIDKAETVTANYAIQHYLSVNSPYGQPSPMTGWHEAESFINVSVTSPIAGSPGTRYVCTGWAGTGSANTTGTDTSATFAIDKPSNMTWQWKTQHLLTINMDPAGLSPSPNVSQAGPWYDNGTHVNCTAQEISGYLFDFWTVDDVNLGHNVDEITIVMDSPHEAVPHYIKVVGWWETLPQPATLQIIIGLAGIVITATLVRTAWVITRRRKDAVKERPMPIEATEVLPNRVNTGYADLDNVLFGGIPKNYSVILTSPSCDERDLLIKRILETGAKNGEVTFYLTIDPVEAKSLAEKFPSNFYLFICNPQADRIIEDLPNVFKLKGVENLTEINIALTKVFRKLETQESAPKRACIDIISDVLLQHQAVRTRRWLTELVTDLKSRGFTTLATLNPQMHSPQEVHAILGLFEGEINVYEREQAEKFLKVKKMYNQRYLDGEIHLRKEKLDFLP